ncbi:MAG: RluA family pseudouridine synthase [Bacilli bacterium]|nr:RluA family pseudouridine synthase [Bacilli bacterium]
MNRNDKKPQRREKGLIDPSKVTEWKSYVETTLIEFLIYKMPQASRNTIKGLLTRHQVAVGGVPVSQYNYKIYPEDIVTVSRSRIAKKTRHDLPILYEDDDLIAMNKPSGLLSVATDRERGKTAYRLVSDYISAKDPKARLFVVHRLDEDTSGVLIFAKNYETREALQNSWQEVVTKRYYYAIVEGKMEKKSGTLRDYLAENDLHLVYVTPNKQKGKLAITHYEVIAENSQYSFLKVMLDSGRKNQIRVQLGHRGHHVIGDDKYGEPSDPIKRLGLHAYELAFTNPLTGKKYDFRAPVPAEFGKVMPTNREEAPADAPLPRKKEVRNTRSETKIAKGKARREAKAHRFGAGMKKHG